MFESIKKTGCRGRNTFFKWKVEHWPKVNYGWVFSRKEGHSLSYKVLEVTEIKQNIDICFFSKFKFQNGLNPKADILGLF